MTQKNTFILAFLACKQSLNVSISEKLKKSYECEIYVEVIIYNLLLIICTIVSLLSEVKFGNDPLKSQGTTTVWMFYNQRLDIIYLSLFQV